MEVSYMENSRLKVALFWNKDTLDLASSITPLSIKYKKWDSHFLSIENNRMEYSEYLSGIKTQYNVSLDNGSLSNFEVLDEYGAVYEAMSEEEIFQDNVLYENFKEIHKLQIELQQLKGRLLKISST